MVAADPELTIGALSARSGVAASALRFYEERGLIHATRTAGGQRRYPRSSLRRVAFVRVAQQVGLTLDEIREALASLPEGRTPTEGDWRTLASSWRPRLDRRIALMQGLRDRLDSCIGCGCLSLGHCRLANPGDVAARRGPGPQYILGTGGAPAAEGGPSRGFGRAREGADGSVQGWGERRPDGWHDVGAPAGRRGGEHGKVRGRNHSAAHGPAGPDRA